MLNGFSFRYVTPWLWTPFTDIFSDWFSNADSRCGRFELACMECMEYYGFKNGKVICKDYYEDFVECKYCDRRFILIGGKLDPSRAK